MACACLSGCGCGGPKGDGVLSASSRERERQATEAKALEGQYQHSQPSRPGASLDMEALYLKPAAEKADAKKKASQARPKR